MFYSPTEAHYLQISEHAHLATWGIRDEQNRLLLLLRGRARCLSLGPSSPPSLLPLPVLLQSTGTRRSVKKGPRFPRPSPVLWVSWMDGL